MTNIKPYLIGIAGPSGVGKSFFAKMLADKIGNHAAIISSDMYYKDQSNLPIDERKKTNMDKPGMIDFELLAEHLKKLKSNEPINIPVYDFTTHTRVSASTKVDPKEVVIVEGLLVLADSELEKLLDLKIYVDADADLRLARRIVRDVAEKREPTVEKAINQYLTSAYPSYKLYVAPQKEKADFVVFWNEIDEKKVEEIADMVRGHLENT